jgi:hypothetical protein
MAACFKQSIFSIIGEVLPLGSAKKFVNSALIFPAISCFAVYLLFSFFFLNTYWYERTKQDLTGISDFFLVPHLFSPIAGIAVFQYKCLSTQLFSSGQGLPLAAFATPALVSRSIRKMGLVKAPVVTTHLLYSASTAGRTAEASAPAEKPSDAFHVGYVAGPKGNRYCF